MPIADHLLAAALWRSKKAPPGGGTVGPAYLAIISSALHESDDPLANGWTPVTVPASVSGEFVVGVGNLAIGYDTNLSSYALLKDSGSGWSVVSGIPAATGTFSPSSTFVCADQGGPDFFLIDQSGAQTSLGLPSPPLVPVSAIDSIWDNNWKEIGTPTARAYSNTDGESYIAMGDGAMLLRFYVDRTWEDRDDPTNTINTVSTDFYLLSDQGWYWIGGSGDGWSYRDINDNFGSSANGEVEFFGASGPKTMALGGDEIVVVPNTSANPAYLLRSSDGGVTWSRVASPDQSAGAPAVFYDGSYFWFGLKASVWSWWRSNDGGATWSSFDASRVDYEQGLLFVDGVHQDNNRIAVKN